jgi:DNA polymerase-3 subunit gamma/tau
MENFVVSARKYRPGTFDTVVGQSHITTTLKNAIANNHLAQAFLFCGPRGVGKTTCARILAKTINCQNVSPETEACDKCESCVAFNKSSSFNIHELDAASNNSVEDIRNLVDQVRYAPQSGKYKIYIIDEVHMLSNAAFNAFLKTLEEPPSYAIFILATTEKHKIIPTILSRCQIFDFNRIQLNDISSHLASIAVKENITAEQEALRLIAQKADGGLRDALSIFDLISTFSSGKEITYKQVIENLHILDYDYYFRLTDAFLAEDLAGALLIFDEILRKGFDGHNFIVGLCEHFRNLLVCKDNLTVKLLEVSENVMKKYADQANSASVSFLLTALNIGSQCDINYKSSKNQRLHVELALMKMVHVKAAVNLAQLPAAPSVSNGNGVTTATGALQAEKKKPDNVEEPQSTPARPAASPQAIPAQPLATPPAATVRNRSGVATSSVKQTIAIPDINQIRTAEPVQVSRAETVAEVLAEPEVLETRPVNLQELNKKWMAFVDQRKQKNPLFINLANKELLLENGFLIRIKVENVILLEQIKAVQGEIINYLRKELQNRSLTLEAELMKPEEMSKSLYTPQEKFAFLLEKYPIIADMRQRFGMEVEY